MLVKELDGPDYDEETPKNHLNLTVSTSREDTSTALSDSDSPPPTGHSTAFETPTHRHSRLLSRMAILSPRSNNYERLEGGLGPARPSPRKFGWKKFAIGAAVLIGLVWFFGPREHKSLWNEPAVDYDDDIDTDLLPPPPAATVLRPPTTPPPSPETPPPKEQTLSLSFETDVDPSKTTQCTSPFSPDLPLVQFALMIDAGSTGSRIHVYKFNNCKESAAYEYEVFKMTQPGLSSFVGKPEDAAKSLDVLMEEAVRVVPEELRKCTPVSVKATAGLRLLGQEQSQDILDAVRARLETSYPFKVEDVVIMDGKDEGVYAWITANYLLGTVDKDSYAVLDLGGASTQIVFEPAFSQPDSSLVDGDHKYDLTFGGKSHVLYQHSYLGYGLMRARRHVHQLVDFMASIRNQASSVVGNPCLARGTSRTVTIDDKTITMDGEQIGSFEACNRVIELVMAKDSICEVKPCSFNGVYQPSLLDSFPTGKVLLLSYFFDRIDPLLAADDDVDSSSLKIGAIADLAAKVCLGRDEWEKHWGSNKEVMDELEGRPEHCLDLTFMHGLLRLGYEFGADREVLVGKKLKGTELGWCLGATIAMVAGDLKCRI